MTSSEARIQVDRERCMGSRNCEFAAPDVFSVGADSVARVVDAAAAIDDQVRDAADQCPMGAITLQDHRDRGVR